MGNKITKEIIATFTYEIVERIVRFLAHIEEIEQQFYSNSSEKKSLINNYKDSLDSLLNTVINTFKDCHESSIQDDDTIFNLLKDILQLINELHTKYLSILPRPIEPVELTRFGRVIHKQIVRLTDKKKHRDISISMNEKIGEEVRSDYLADFKNKVSDVLNKYGIQERFKIDQHDQQNNKLHITIPRIDASNTFRWPSLIHEMAHSLFLEVEFKEGCIEKEFLNYTNGSENTLIIDFFRVNNDVINSSSYGSKLKNWLTECWSDLFACILIGPSYYFSEYLAFLNTNSIEDQTHPPASFRLDLIESIITHRFPQDLNNILGDKYFEDCTNLIGLLQEESSESIDYIKRINIIQNCFNRFFTSHFFSCEKEDGISQLKNNPKINERVTVLVNKYVRIYPVVIEYLSNRLKDGLPIPSIRIKSRKSFREIPTYVQEIFLASWLSRKDDLQQNVLEVIRESENKNIQNGMVITKIRRMILRHDQAVLKSIQVSEWFDFFIQERKRPDSFQVYENSPQIKSKSKGVLVDTEIKGLINSDELKIIPMMYIDHIHKDGKLNQIGTTSVDIRLGTSFQIFYPDQYGIIDFTQDDHNQIGSMSSKRVNLDFIEGITITPGQFLLGHSMEYVKLPDYLCGNLEGRSSFARLGIEIHMTAGYIDPGFEGVITFEIYNAGPTTVRLYPGMRVGQIRFERNSIPGETYSKKHTVKYKGLLEHDLSRQSKDFEVNLIKEYNIKNRKK
ncbi:dCTP deaminase [Dysgonomonas capnocytophagoides]|uniref:dCTP deaminase n=1 Tax=Dysgonomonas capnocytophagoides TaxID=45254 RepID=UPI00291FDCB3|nr:hypothetical protein DCPSUM001_00810 [Dysgonomonas capnocytophagoides]